VPDSSDPSFAREERRARARRAAAEASPERQQELRDRHAPPPAPPREPSRPRAAKDPAGSVDIAAVAASARAALDAHPSTWTSYAELCSANRLDRGLALAVARRLGPGAAGDHWFRIRSSDGVYEAGRGDPARFSQDAADRALEAIGVPAVRRHADPERKLLWMHGEWCLAGR
jgi:hypothetical protein